MPTASAEPPPKANAKQSVSNGARHRDALTDKKPKRMNKPKAGKSFRCKLRHDPGVACPTLVGAEQLGKPAELGLAAPRLRSGATMDDGAVRRPSPALPPVCGASLSACMNSRTLILRWPPLRRHSGQTENADRESLSTNRAIRRIAGSSTQGRRLRQPIRGQHDRPWKRAGAPPRPHSPFNSAQSILNAV